MRLTRVHLPAPLSDGALVELPAGPALHLTRVLRLEEGAALTVFNGEGGEHAAVIASIRRGTVVVRVGAHHAVECESPLDVTLLQGIARGDKMDLILQKATELGVTRIVPVTMVRSSVRLTADTARRKQKHWVAVVAGACEQCGRNRVPQVAAPTSLAEAVQSAQQGLKLLLSPHAAAEPLGALLAKGAASPAPAVSLLVGPEGGFDQDETRLARLAGFMGCRLGPRVLRTETAALVALAVLQSAYGDIG
jgi:16S rRNA (uracil1498-N3)-methyltransferase